MNDEFQYKPLNIIKASAGSGKTHRLAFEYIRLVLQNPSLFKQILAVTFTNKATAEMKMRIIAELEQIAREPSNSKMISDLTRATQMDAAALSKQAGQVLVEILHEYGHFSISTIDHFFQGIVRVLTRELNLSGGYRVQIDQREIIEQAVEAFLADLKSSEEQMKLMLDFVEARMSDDKSWNVQRELANFTNQLFREQVRYYFVRNKGSLTGDTTPDQVRKALNIAITNFEKRLSSWANECREFFNKSGIDPQDLEGKGRSPIFTALNHVEKKKYDELSERLERMQNVENWMHKHSEKQGFSNTLNDFLNLKTEEFKSILKKEYAYYLEAKALYQNIFQHSLAGGLMQKVSDYLVDQNLFMLSDAPVLLNLFTDDTDTPFIYEKTGHRFRHYMIDEFQDTSALQWSNFKPLVEESVASVGYGNFIVGDVKQAIYRWRNGDWSLLQQKVAQDIPNHGITNLQQNWRSHERIVTFNNTFFNKLVANWAEYQTPYYKELLKDMYADVEQIIPDKIIEQRKGGYVFLQSVVGDKVEDYKENALIKLHKQIDRLVKQNNQNGLCVLVRKNDEVQQVASYLINNTSYNIISSGSMTLSSSRMLQLIISVFRYLIDPQPLYLKTIAYLNTFHSIDTSYNELFLGDEAIHLPEVFLKQIDKLSNTSALNLIGALIEIFELEKVYPNQSAFLSRFYNETKKVSGEKGGGLKPVVDWWEREGDNLSIEISDTDPDSISIMTIHKSKGLQFNHVLMPFAQGYPNKKLDTMWIDGNAFSIDAIQDGLYPVTLNKQHQNSPGLSPYLDKEIYEQLVDQLNTLYVAMTRAKRGLFVFFHAQASKNDDVSFWFQQFLNDESANSVQEQGRYSEEGSFEYGDLEHATEKPRVEKQAIAVHPSNIANIALKSEDQHLSMTPNENLMASRGSLLHRIFEQIITEKDIKTAILNQYLQGYITENEQSELHQLIGNWLEQSEVKDWFSDGIDVLTEADIISPGTHSSRPDRIVFKDNKVTVIDYKFGQQVRKDHEQQVQEYCDLIKQMGYSDIHGVVWYPLLRKVVNIKK